MPFIKLDSETIQQLLDSDDPRQELTDIILKAEDDGDTERVLQTIQEVVQDTHNSPDHESKEVH